MAAPSATQIRPEPVANFRRAMLTAGIGEPRRIIADGAIHRFRGDGDKPGRSNAWYVLHIDGKPAGAFGSWRTGETHTWTADQTDAHPGDLARTRRLVEAARAQREAEARAQFAAAAHRARIMLEHSYSADPAHPYLTAKGIRPHGARQQGIALLIPVFAGGAIASVQTILHDGTKRFLRGGRMAGGYYRIDDETTRAEILVAEGFGTGATLHERTGATVYVAFNAGNLLPVARYVRALHPAAEIIVGGDNDQWTDGNPGVTKARAAALAIGARLLVPDFTGMDLARKPTDFNDWYSLRDAQGATHA